MRTRLQPAGRSGATAENATLTAGQRIAQYRILRLLGEGGMGQVYLADDVQLNRKVALKTLPPGFAANRARLERLKREARTVAALNHPNIVTIFSQDSEDGLDFLAMEYVRGRTLAELIPRHGLDLSRFFRLAVPMVDAISAAHDGGITHRDLKPVNVMVAEGDRVKVLDFGLAKATDTTAEDPTEATTATAAQTAEGAVVGTRQYMSPEQMRGEELDGRSDIFSLGIVLYEMSTGRHPFGGHSSAEVISSVMRDVPEPLSRRRRDLPHHLERIVERCLEKDPEHRYQSAKDLRNDLGFLRRELEEHDREEPPTWVERKTQTLRNCVRPALGFLAGLVLAAVAWLLFGRGETSPPTGLPRQVTAGSSWEAEVAISPDGRTLAFATSQSGNEDIWLIDVRGGGRMRLTEHPAADRAPAWFPDGNALAFQSDRGGMPAIWKIPRLGGSATMLVARAVDPAISPDGSRIAFAQVTESVDSRIGVASLENPSAVTLLTGQQDGLWGHRQPAWSPDGRSICYADANDLWIVPAADGTPRRLTTDSEGDGEPAWSSDGRFIYFSSYREGTLALWRVAVRGGRPQRLTGGTGPERQPSISRDGSLLAYTTYVNELSIELVDLASGIRQRLLGGRSDFGAAVAPDGRAVVFVSNRAGRFNLWRQNLGDSGIVGPPFRLSDEAADASNPDYSPDGEWIAYQRRNDEGERNIWIVPASGGVPRPFTSGAGVRVHPAFAPDGSQIAYVSDLEGRSELWVAPVAAGAPAGRARQLAAGAENLLFPDWSPDGSRIAHLGVVGGILEIWVTAVSGGEPPRQLTQGAAAGSLRWNHATGKLMVSGLWDGEVPSLRELDPDSGLLTAADSGVEFDYGESGLFDLSADGQLLALTRERVRGDVWTLEGKGRVY